MQKISIFDSTLRDGAQAEGISFSVEDKLKIVKALDEFGVGYIEAGNPGSNPKDLEFFRRAGEMRLQTAKLVAFGSTRRCDASVADDKNVQSLLAANTNIVAIVGKSWDFHVTDILNTTLAENLLMIADTIAFCKQNGKMVLFDAEHFFDGYKADADYALQTLQTAADAGADTLVLCDTNGGAFPQEIAEITCKVVGMFDVPVAIHCHDDCGMAAANSLLAVDAGAAMVQGTFTGFGERCGNAALCTIIPALQLKRGYACIPDENMAFLTHTARLVTDVANIPLPDDLPFVGRGAFTHKGGMHIDGVSKAAHSFEHLSPESVGNERRLLTSEVAGRSTILKKIQKVQPGIQKDSPETAQIIDTLKDMEYQGYQFEAAESTFDLIIRKKLGKYKPFFELVNFKIIGEQPYDKSRSSSAVIKVIVDGKEEITAAEGKGPVNALDKALRKALEVFYPQLASVHLTDYKVRVLDGEATAAKVRVLIESSDGANSWSNVGVSNDIIEASWIALVDSIEYKLLKDMEAQG